MSVVSHAATTLGCPSARWGVHLVAEREGVLLWDGKEGLVETDGDKGVIDVLFEQLKARVQAKVTRSERRRQHCTHKALTLSLSLVKERRGGCC